MASKSTINKRVNIYINGREVTNDIKSIRAEMQKAVNQQAKMTIGSEEIHSENPRNPATESHHPGTQPTATDSTTKMVFSRKSR